ncbi:MAG: glycosyltransferase [Acidobacteria bacterium]|nr:glycosyltransferase [Acidobacteriota bacterium]
MNSVPPKVSVVIPMYNAAPYLAETLQSIFVQTLQDYEILAIDDGSTDETLSLARSYEPRLQVFTQKNSGPSAARNLGFRHAQGEYIAWLDSDDLWHPELLETQVAFLDQHPNVGLVYAESWIMMQEGTNRIITDKVGYTVNPGLKLLLYGDCIPTNTIVMRRSCYETIGDLNESLIRAEDHEYLMRISYHFELAGIARPLAYYRFRPHSLVGDNRDINRGVRDAVIALQSVESLHPDVWQRTGVNRAQLLARLQIRAAHAWKLRREWAAAIGKACEAFSYCRYPLVLRWIAAAFILKRWS